MCEIHDLVIYLVKFSIMSKPSELCSDHFPSQLHRPGGINKDLTVWLDGGRPSPKYIFKKNMSSTNSKIDQLQKNFANVNEPLLVKAS